MVFGKKLKRDLEEARKRIEELERKLEAAEEEKLELGLKLSEAESRVEELGSALQLERSEHDSLLTSYQVELKKFQNLLQRTAEQLDFEKNRAERYEEGYLILTGRVKKLIQRCRELKEKLGKEPVLRIGDIVYGRVEGSRKRNQVLVSGEKKLQLWRYFEVEEGEQVRYKVLEQRGAACVGYFVDNQGELDLERKVKIEKARRIFRPSEGEWEKRYLYAGFPEGLVRVRSGCNVPGEFKIHGSYTDRRFGKVYSARPVQ